MDQPQEYTLVTGALSEIGEAVARRIAPGRRVILQGQDLEQLRVLRLSLPRPESHLIWPQDLHGNAEIAESLCVLLANSSAGISGFVHCAEEIHSCSDTAGPGGVLRVFEMNYFSATAIIRVLCKKATNHGALRGIVFVTNIASRFGVRGLSTYAATKGALDSLARSLAAEFAPAVRVNSVLAGHHLCPAEEQVGCLLGPGEPQDIAGVCAYLLSDDTRWITGQQFVVDGGKTAH
jgi:NAD(P)-dependent dehydrogenase (short-subunit alcohol dehydrogenase family)